MLAIAKGANLALMFFLELGVLAAAGYWGLSVSDNWAIKLLVALAAIALFIAVWAVFGAAANARIPLTGIWRAVLEIGWFGGAAALLYAAGATTQAVVFALVFVLNAVLRIVWKQV
ncbi:YrdB family protein [Nonomuraea sp. NPDC050556]|uniref:YrdB family protein n=1 Tax=Nonomuraea sp. NPDC050556 TaxID=3364369 RepID=UPI003793C299